MTKKIEKKLTLPLDPYAVADRIVSILEDRWDAIPAFSKLERRVQVLECKLQEPDPRLCRWCHHTHHEKDVKFGHRFDGPRWGDGTLILDQKYPPSVRGNAESERQWDDLVLRQSKNLA